MEGGVYKWHLKSAIALLKCPALLIYFLFEKVNRNLINQLRLLGKYLMGGIR